MGLDSDFQKHLVIMKDFRTVTHLETQTMTRLETQMATRLQTDSNSVIPKHSQKDFPKLMDSDLDSHLAILTDFPMPMGLDLVILTETLRGIHWNSRLAIHLKTLMEIQTETQMETR